jgi:hypothetical protein
VAPNLDPLGVAVAAKGIAERVGGGLVVALHEEDFADAVGGERAILVGVESLLVLDETSCEVSLGDLLLAAQDGYADGKVRRALEQPILGIDADVAGTAEGFDGVVTLGAGHVDAADFGFAVGFDAEFNGHTEEIEILLDRADGAEALVVAKTEDCEFIGESRCAGSVEPLREERG